MTTYHFSTLLSTSLLLQKNWQHIVNGLVPNIIRKDAYSLSIECDNEKDMKVVMQLVVKSNLFRKTAIEKDTIITELITKLENELKHG